MSMTAIRAGRNPLLAWLRLARVYQKVERAAIEQLRDYGLSLAQFDVLTQIQAREGMTQQELADALLVTKGNVCQLLGRMEQSGLLERHQDGRANRLALTEAGRSLLAEALPAHQTLIAEQFSALAPAEQVQLLGLLRSLDHALGADASHPQLESSPGGHPA